jgi:hypothetical protein
MLTLCIITANILSNCHGTLYYFDKHTGLQPTNKKEVHANIGHYPVETGEMINLIGYELPEVEDLRL